MLNLNAYLIKQQVALMQMACKYDIFDPNTNEQVAQAREEIPTSTQLLRFFMNKQTLPTSINIYDQDSNELLFSIKRGFTLFRARVDVCDGKGNVVGYFKRKMLSIGAGFWVYDTKDAQFAEVKGDWKGWNFKFLTAEGQELGTVSKQWAGLAKELFTSADTYVVAINDSAKSKENSQILLLAAGLAIDTIFKE